MKNASLHTLSSLVLAGVALATSVAAQAAPITYNWSTTATTNVDQFGLRAGDRITGVLTYDLTGSSKTNGNTMGGPGAGYQYYATPHVSTTLSLGTYQGTIPLYTMIVNDFQMWGGDEIFFRANATPVGSFQLQFLDSSMTALSSLDLPETVDMQKYGSVHFSVNNWPSQIRTSVDTFAAASADVPEPGSVALFGLAMAALAAARRRTR